MRSPVLFAGLVLLIVPSVARAGDLDFVVPPNDGYGIADCMKPGEACGQVIADAWCEAHGHAHASAFGLAEDVTGAIKVATVAVTGAPAPGSVMIRCSE